MIIYQEGSDRMAFAVADLLDADFKDGNREASLHYGVNYLMAVGEEITKFNFEYAPKAEGITELQYLSVLIDHVSRLGEVKEVENFKECLKLRKAEYHLRKAQEALDYLSNDKTNWRK